MNVRPDIPREHMEVYSNVFSRDVLPGLIKPLVWSINIPLVNGAWVRVLQDTTGTRGLEPEELAKQFYYRAYFKMSELGRVWTRMGLPRDSLEQLMGVGETGRHFKIQPDVRMMVIVPNVAFFLVRRFPLAERVGRSLPKKRAVLEAMYNEPLAAMPDSDLKSRVERLTAEIEPLAYYSVIAALFSSIYKRMLERLLAKAGKDASEIEVISGDRDLRHYYPVQYMDQLHARFMDFDDSARQRIKAEGYSSLFSIDGTEAFRSELDQLIQTFGHLSESGNDFSSKQWREDPDFVISLVIDHTHQKKGDCCKTKFGDLEEGLGPLVRLIHHQTRKYLILRERISSTYTFGYSLYRRYFLEIGQRLVERGALEERDHVFYLFYDEVREAIEGEARGFSSLAMARKLEMEMMAQFDPPEIIIGDAPPEIVPERVGVLVGTPVSRGRIRGRVRIVRRTEDFRLMKEGEVLVVPYSEPSWTPLFSKALAVVSESGGILSHAAVLAREYGIPAVVSVRGATRLTDGMEVEVDGSVGTVTIIAPPPPGGEAEIPRR